MIGAGSNGFYQYELPCKNKNAALRNCEARLQGWMLDELNNCDPVEISVNRILIAVETGTAHDGDDSTLGGLQ